MRVRAAVLNDPAVEDDAFGLGDSERRAFDVVGEVRFEEGEVLACEAAWGRVSDGGKHLAVQCREERVEQVEAARVVRSAGCARQGLTRRQVARSVCTQQRADDAVQARELRRHVQQGGQRSTCIAQIVQPVLAAQGQHLVELHLDFLLRQHALRPATTSTQVLQEPPRLAGQEQGAVGHVPRGAIGDGWRSGQHLDGQPRQLKLAARPAACDKQLAGLRPAVER